MGGALIGGLIRSGWASASECLVVEPRADVREQLEDRFTGLATSATASGPGDTVLAVKPADAERACRAVAPAGGRRVMSVVAGLRIATLQHWLGPSARIIRAMPNTPALVGTGASAVSGGPTTSEEDLEWAEGVLSSVGVVVRVAEGLIDAVTGLSGSGPAYVFLLVEALVEAGVLVGLSREASGVLAVQTVLGSARMLAESGEPPERLRHNVTSPGGTTAAALRALEDRGFRAAILDAVSAAAARSGELSRPA